jgi:hypothetical protein
LSGWIQIISSIGTLLFAGIAIFAIFYPQMLSWYNRPKFDFAIDLAGEIPAQVQMLFIKVTNNGRRVAHGVVGLIKIYDSDRKILLEGRIPVIIITEPRYEGVILYPCESVGFLCIRNGKTSISFPPHIEITSYPFKWDCTVHPALTSIHSEGRANEKFIQENRMYFAHVLVVCEEQAKPSEYQFGFVYEAGRIRLIPS